MGYVEWNSIGAIAQAQLKSANTKGVVPIATSDAGKLNRLTEGSNAGLTYPKAEQLTQASSGVVTAPVSGCTNLRANAYGVGNSLATSDLSQFPIAYAAAGSVCKEAYKTTSGTAAAVDVGQLSGQINAAGASAVVTAITAADGTIAVTAGASSKIYCNGPSVGYLTPYYIGTKWASEAATAVPGTQKVTTIDAGGLAQQANNAPAAGGAYKYQ